MTISVEKFQADLTPKQSDMLNGILARDNSLSIEGIVANTRFNRESTTEGWQLLQRFMESRSDEVTRGQRYLLKAYKAAFKAAGVNFPVTVDQVAASRTKADYSKLIVAAELAADFEDIKLPERTKAEIDSVVAEEGDEEPF